MTSLGLIILLLAIYGGINSLQFTIMNILTLIDLPPMDFNSGNSLLSVVMQLSISMGVSLAAVLLSLTHGAAEPALAAFSRTFLLVGLIAVLSALIFVYTPKNTGASSSEK